MPVQKHSGNLLKASHIINHLIKHQSFIYTQLIDQTVLFQIFNLALVISFHSLNVKHFYLTLR